METMTEILPVRKASKKSAMQWTPATEAQSENSTFAGVLVIHTDRASVTYAVSEFPCDWPGRGFHLAKQTSGTDPESESYSVFCAKSGPAGDQCECRGWVFKGTCKHRDAMRAILANEWV